MPPGLPGETPPPPPLEYHAGVCAATLHNLPVAIGPIRHDDVHSYASETFVSDAGIVVRRLSERMASSLDEDTRESSPTIQRVDFLRFLTVLFWKHTQARRRLRRWPSHGQPRTRPSSREFVAPRGPTPPRLAH